MNEQLVLKEIQENRKKFRVDHFEYNFRRVFKKRENREVNFRSSISKNV